MYLSFLMFSASISKKMLPRLMLLAILSLLFLISWLVFIDGNTAPDEKIFNALAPYINPQRTAWMKTITFFGNHKFLVPANLILIAILLFRKENFAAFQVTLVALSSLALKVGLKDLFQRPRPDNPLVMGITNFSYPSGHALMGVAFFGLLIWIAALSIRNTIWRRIGIALLVFFILLIGFSRIYLRVHYTTDVIAGYCLGICWLYLCMLLTEKLAFRWKQQDSGFINKP